MMYSLLGGPVWIFSCHSTGPAFALVACRSSALRSLCPSAILSRVFPLIFSAFGLSVECIGMVKAVYPAVWGCLQILTGPLSDRWGRKWLIVTGMWVQAVGIFATVVGRSFGWWMLGSILLGLGTAMVYPSLIAAISDNSHPSWRGRTLSVCRFWRDLGYAVGALSVGIIADTLGISWAIWTVGALTFLSGGVVAAFLREKEQS